jgi:DUF1680 family protein
MGELITRRSWLLGFAASTVPAIAGLAGALSQTPPTPVIDQFSLADPGSVQIRGLLGDRCRKNALAWLAAKDENELLAGFRRGQSGAAEAAQAAGRWLHAATLAFAYSKDLEQKAKLDRVAAVLIGVQLENGYLGAPQLAAETEQHAGGGATQDLLLGLLAYHAQTGNQAALDAAKRIGDLLLKSAPAPTTRFSYGLLEPVVLLFRSTKDDRYLTLARSITDQWEAESGAKPISVLTQQNTVRKTQPLKARELLSGLVGLCELYRATGEVKFLTPAINAWNDIVENQLLITGGASSHGDWTDDKRFAYGFKDEAAETCVTVYWIELTAQLLRIRGDARYADELEKSIYNQLAAAQRPDGAAWAVYTPLEDKKLYSSELTGCSAAGPLAWAMVPEFVYMSSDDGVVVNFLTPGAAFLKVRGESITVKQEVVYPLDGRVMITVTVPKPMKFALRVRTPAWSQINGFKSKPGQYWLLRQTWSKTQTITLDFSIPVRVLKGGGAADGKIAIARGPQILALDKVYNPELEPLTAYAPAVAEPRLTMSANYRDPDGLSVFETEGVAVEDTARHKAGDRVTIRLVSFAAAGAHGHEYRVWLPMAKTTG